jgi:predicted nucleotidyltransferase component of viral defense system
VTTEHASLLVDLALETVELPPPLTVVGPTIAEQEVAVGKLIALFDLAEARDFVDVFEFCQRYEPPYC